MIRIILVAALFGFFYTANAQQAPIAIVSSNGTTRLTSTLDSAAILADTNDIIYLPGGPVVGQSGNTWFTKKVTIIGVGHHLDSTAATGRTFVNGYLGFAGNADGSIVDGIYLTLNLYIGSDIKIYRSNVENIICSELWPIGRNLVVDKSIVRTGIYGYNNSIINASIKNSIFSGNDYSTNHTNSTFENCIFLIENGGQFVNSSLCTYKNCTFTGITDWGAGSGNGFFYNNIMASTTLPNLINPGNASGNYLNQSTSQTFIDTLLSANYQYSKHYKLNSSSPGYNGGTDGKDVGIYGGTSPWVIGNIPPNPHIRMKNVNAATSAGGSLRVQFNVSAQ